jgi:L-ascorbate metabolism protein UlaG (beta-lactamase superfamily)
MFEYQGIKIFWLGHSSFKIKNGKTIYIDPFQIKAQEVADIIFITHEHHDHCSKDDIEKIAIENTTIVTTKMAKAKLNGLKVGKILVVRPGDRLRIDGVNFEVVAAYNINKFRSPGIPFHPREDEKVGFIISVDNVTIYHAGDTDFIPEMKNVKADIVLIPVSGTYVMTAEEAAKAINTINPKIAIPMHYGSFVGNEDDARRFQKLAKCEVKILERER